VVDPETETQHLEFEPANDEHVRALSIANRWQSTAPADTARKVRLLRAIASKLSEPGGFVFYHFDGGTSWSERGEHKTRNKFRSIVEHGVRNILQMHLEQQGQSEKEVREFVEDAMARLISIVPHYSIEAWCFQNVAAARDLCVKHHQGCPGQAAFQNWEQDRGVLDEIEKPKEACCLHDKHNCELVGPGFPRDEAYRTGKSFAFAVGTMSRCNALTRALAMTHTYPKPPPVC
jgi:hypothetical protein